MVGGAFKLPPYLGGGGGIQSENGVWVAESRIPAGGRYRGGGGVGGQERKYVKIRVARQRVQGRISTREHCQEVGSTQCTPSQYTWRHLEVVSNNNATCFGSTFDDCQGLQASSAVDACQNVNPTLSTYQNARSYHHHTTTTILLKGELFAKTRSGRAFSRKVYQTSLIPTRIRKQRSKSKRNGTRQTDRQFTRCVLGIEGGGRGA